jgi:hypothetical protein
MRHAPSVHRLTTFALGLALLAGCDNLALGPDRSSAERPEDFTSTIVPATPVKAVRPVAVQVFKEHFRFNAANSTDTVLRSFPQDAVGRVEGETPEMREVLTGRNRRRRESAIVELAERGPDVVVRCQVQVQRLAAPQRAAFAPQTTGDDRPAARTEAERSTAQDTREQDRWVSAGRDRQLERTIVNQIAERLGRPTGAAGSTTRPQVP